MMGSIITRAAALLLVLALAVVMQTASAATARSDDPAPQHVSQRIAEEPIARSPDPRAAVARGFEGALSWDEHRRDYALVAAIALLLAGAAIAFSLPPRH